MRNTQASLKNFLISKHHLQVTVFRDQFSSVGQSVGRFINLCFGVGEQMLQVSLLKLVEIRFLLELS